MTAGSMELIGWLNAASVLVIALMTAGLWGALILIASIRVEPAGARRVLIAAGILGVAAALVLPLLSTVGGLLIASQLSIEALQLYYVLSRGLFSLLRLIPFLLLLLGVLRLAAATSQPQHPASQ